MLSKRAEKLLKWMSKQESAAKVSDIEQNCKDFDASALKALAKNGFVAYQFDEDFFISPVRRRRTPALP